ncbi:laminin subunit alpha-1-like [Microtus ochrogaster]|uniref:Laminin subunit alpha-1-like n=1 Tax=Microtus ochrogaster TaxID=79684 RepID=A0ABM1UEN7_MICOH|nr:laminin subunit alpha-1-like [Microtus ochrogaster]
MKMAPFLACAIWRLGCVDCKPQVTGQQCDQCLPGYYGLDTGRGCVPCNYSVEGCTSDNCTKNGQCSCVPGVGGKTCDRCSHGLYGYQDGGCTPCDCAHTQNNCDPDSGECLCPPHTQGLKCEECKEGYWNLDPERGCQACNCSIAGSTGPQCDVLSGQCHCKEGFGGQNCDQCSLGYRRFPDCVPCDCDPRGTLADTCDLEQGLCSCTEDSGTCSCKIMLAFDELLLHVVSQSNLKGTVEGVHFQDPDTLLDAEAVLQHVHGEPFYWRLPKQFEGDEDCAPGYHRGKLPESCGWGPRPLLAPCVPCSCNNHSDVCDLETGQCLEPAGGIL